jgi:hypothetical protein
VDDPTMAAYRGLKLFAQQELAEKHAVTKRMYEEEGLRVVYKFVL